MRCRHCDTASLFHERCHLCGHPMKAGESSLECDADEALKCSQFSATLTAKRLGTPLGKLTMKTTPEKILQIIPAPGWSALYLEDDGRTVAASALACFALVSYGIHNGQEERGIEAIDGCFGGVEFVSIGNSSNFVGLRSPTMSNELVAKLVDKFKASREVVWHGTTRTEVPSELNCGKKVVGPTNEAECAALLTENTGGLPSFPPFMDTAGSPPIG